MIVYDKPQPNDQAEGCQLQASDKKILDARCSAVVDRLRSDIAHSDHRVHATVQLEEKNNLKCLANCSGAYQCTYLLCYCYLSRWATVYPVKLVFRS